MVERDPDTEHTEATERSAGPGQGPQTLAQLQATGAEVVGSDGEWLDVGGHRFLHQPLKSLLLDLRLFHPVLHICSTCGRDGA